MGGLSGAWGCGKFPFKCNFDEHLALKNDFRDDVDVPNASTTTDHTSPDQSHRYDDV